MFKDIFHFFWFLFLLLRTRHNSDEQDEMQK